jgi:spore coat polysaccharide biosynthesis protein SpsF
MGIMTKSERTVAILQARTSSSRLPGKVLCDLAGAPMLARQLERVARARLLDKIVVATSSDPSDDPLARLVGNLGFALFRGSLDDVLGRFVGAVAAHPAEHVVRLTGDCPLADPDVIDAVVAHHIANAVDATTNSVEPTFPDGLDVEVVRADVLRTAGTEASGPVEREHVTPFVYRHPERFSIQHYKGARDLSGMRWTVDEPADLEFASAVFAALLPSNPTFGMHDVLRLLAARPELAQINSEFKRNEGLDRSLAAEAASS